MQTDALLLIFTAHLQLADHVATILRANKVSFRHDDCLLIISTESIVEHIPIVQVLRQNIDSSERKFIKVGNTLSSPVLGVPDLDVYAEILETSWFEDALAQDDFSIFFQPIFNISLGKPVAYEALIRLESDRLYNGEEIVSAAMMRGDILTFDQYARTKAIRSASSFRQFGTKLFINFFPSAMEDPASYIDATLKSIQDAGFNPSDVVFEIVEYDYSASISHVRGVCEFFRQYGFLYALDDLGIGTNGLDMIERLRPNYVKIDKSMIWHIGEASVREMIMDARKLSHRVGAEVIAEGIETTEQADEVRKIGIQLMQGFHLGRPSPQINEGTSLRGLDPQVIQDLLLLSSAVATTTGSTNSSVQEMKDRVRVSSSRTRRVRT